MGVEHNWLFPIDEMIDWRALILVYPYTRTNDPIIMEKRVLLHSRRRCTNLTIYYDKL